jgi:hypothetical protein
MFLLLFGLLLGASLQWKNVMPCALWKFMKDCVPCIDSIVPTFAA